MSLFPRRCKHPTCAASTRHPSGYCDRHADKRPAKRFVERRATKERRAERDQFYSSAEWRKARAAVLKRHPRCQIKLPGCTGHAECVDHKTPIAAGGAKLDPANLRSACWRCHSVVTARYDGGFGHDRQEEE